MTTQIFLEPGRLPFNLHVGSVSYTFILQPHFSILGGCVMMNFTPVLHTLSWPMNSIKRHSSC